MVIKPEYEKTQDFSAQIKENKVMIELATELRDKQTKLQEKNVAISQEERTRLEKILPETVDNVRLILDISNIGDFTVVRNIGINESASGPNKAKELAGNSNYGSIQLSFSFTSSYENLKTFVRKLEDSLRLVDIRELSVTASGQNSNQYDVGVKLNTYWLR